MTLAPEIQSLLEWGIVVAKRYPGLSQSELRPIVRDELDAELSRRGARVDAVGAIRNDCVPVGDGAIDVRIFLPDAAGPHPVFLHLHGGGFVFGTVHSLVNEVKCAHVCRVAECAVVTVDYRLAPERRFPTAVEDSYAALLWTVENADRLGVDGERIAVGGESAGGNLAAALALAVRDRNGPPLALQLLEVPVTDISPAANEHASVAHFAEGYGLERAEMDTFIEAYLPEARVGLDPYASPLLASDLSGLAPAHVLTAEYDLLRDSGEAYARRLAEAGVPATLHRYPGFIHGAPVLWQEWAPARAWMDDVTSAIRNALHTVVPQ